MLVTSDLKLTFNSSLQGAIVFYGVGIMNHSLKELEVNAYMARDYEQAKILADMIDRKTTDIYKTKSDRDYYRNRCLVLETRLAECDC